LRRRDAVTIGNRARQKNGLVEPLDAGNLTALQIAMNSFGTGYGCRPDGRRGRRSRGSACFIASHGTIANLVGLAIAARQH
jgi:hypothetical protein